MSLEQFCLEFIWWNNRYLTPSLVVEKLPFLSVSYGLLFLYPSCIKHIDLILFVPD